MEGLITGAGVPLLVIGYINRNGPGNVCTERASGICTSFAERSSPWPFVAVGVLLVALGLIVFAVRRRRAEQVASATPKS